MLWGKPVTLRFLVGFLVVLYCYWENDDLAHLHCISKETLVNK